MINTQDTMLLKTLAVILLLLLGCSAIQSFRFYQAQKQWTDMQWPTESELVFSLPERAVSMAPHSLPALDASHFRTEIYATRYFACTLAVKQGEHTQHYWWFLNPMINRIVLLPAAVWGDRPSIPTLVYPSILSWKTENDGQLYRALRQQLGDDKAVHELADLCKVRPAAYVF